MTDSIVISGFGKADVNGVYAYWEDKNGYPAYKNDLGYIVMYVGSRLPYANNEGYILLTPLGIQGAIRIEAVPYIKISDVANATTTGWTSTLPNTSGETDVETPWYESSSESSASSASSASSQSNSSSSSIDSSSSTSTSSSSS